jgi:DNA-directed RNA polymerase subunit RPC12/RpoP
MATETKYICSECGQEQWYSLFEALSAKAKSGLKCPTCKGEVEMRLKFNFGLHGRVVDAFLPDDISKWYKRKEHEHWEFHPFLVIIESLNKVFSKYQVWQPYWHKVTQKDGSVRTPYGQWATCLDMNAFQQLLTKAKGKGYL